MKKMRKMVLAITLIGSLMFATTAHAASNAYLEQIASAIWKLAKYGSNQLINVSGTTETSCGWVRKSTGGFKFNSGNNGASVRLSINLGQSNMYLDAFPYTDALHWNETVSFILTSPSNTDVISKTLTHNQHATYNSKSPYGTYTARFVDDESIYWNCYVAVTDWNVACSYGGESSGYMKSYVVNPENEKVYFVPSSSHKANTRAVSAPILSINELLNQFYDVELGEYVTSLRDYNIDDEIIIRDVIADIQYDSSNDCTYICFNSANGLVKWPFLGDLTEQYKTGESISFTFSVIKEYESNNMIFENLDYFVDGNTALQNNTYLSIDNYLVQ